MGAVCDPPERFQLIREPAKKGRTLCSPFFDLHFSIYSLDFMIFLKLPKMGMYRR